MTLPRFGSTSTIRHTNSPSTIRLANGGSPLTIQRATTRFLRRLSFTLAKSSGDAYSQVARLLRRRRYIPQPRVVRRRRTTLGEREEFLTNAESVELPRMCNAFSVIGANDTVTQGRPLARPTLG